MERKKGKKNQEKNNQANTDIRQSICLIYVVGTGTNSEPFCVFGAMQTITAYLKEFMA